jgi:hypothetical protein
MNTFTRMLLPLAAVSAFASPALAESLRIPVDGTPAIEVSKQTGWTEKYDDYGNLTLFADDKSGGMLFRTITTGPGEKMPSNAAVAEMVLGAAGAKPYSKTEATTFAGGPAEAYYSTMEVSGGPVIQLKLVVRKLDDSHLTVAVTMVPDSTPADKRKAIETQFAAVKIVTR